MERQTLTAVTARHVNHEAQVRRDHPVLGLDVAALDALGELDFLGSCEQRVLRRLLEEQLQRLEVAGLLVPLVLLDGRLVRALVITTARGSAAVDTAPEMLLLLSVVVRFRSLRLRQTSERVLCARLTY